jgi:molybdenum cofactor cytidylyltransferase
MSDPDRTTGGDQLPVVDPAEFAPRGDGEPATGRENGGPAVAGVLLAAGMSTRFEGDNKLLVELDGEPIVARAAETLLSTLPVVVAVVGHEANRVTATLSRTDDGRLVFAGNPDYREGQATSVRAGVRAVAGADAVVVALGDMPSVDSATVGELVRAYRGGAGSALAAAVDGRRGNPVLFDASHFAALTGVEGDTGGREVLISAADSALVETGDPGVRRDVNAPADVDAVGDAGNG